MIHGQLSADPFRAVDTRLADLQHVGGEALVRRTLQRFDEHLAGALAEGAAGWNVSFAHRTAGLAAMLGFERLADACRAVELSEAANPGAQIARAALEAMAARHELARRLAAFQQSS